MVDAREYHERTKHSPRSVRDSDFRLDPTTRPRPYKIYEDLPRRPPSDEADPPTEPVLSAIAQPGPEPSIDPGDDAPADPDVYTLCRYATGVTKTLERGGRQLRFRAAACTGKLYHVDLYAVTGRCGEFDPGIYHYDPDGDALDVLREGEYRDVLAAASGRESVAEAPVTFVLTSQWWRNAWKYRERTYRHAFWDSGTILANLLAVAHGGGHRAEVVTAFADDPVARLLGLDPDEEAPLELVPVGEGDPVPDGTDSTVDPINPAEAPLSDEVVEYPLVPEAWRESRLPDGDAARKWRERLGAAAVGTNPPGDGARVNLDPVDAETASSRPVGVTIERRGSLREYGHEPVSQRKVATVLDRALRGAPVDCPDSRRPCRLVDCYCLVHAVEGIPSGAYQYHPEERFLERIGDTDRTTAGHLALDQSVVGDAAVNVYLLADVDAIVDELGDRGYRAAQLEAGITLGRLYLGTYAHLALGGRGFTFYDDLVTDHLSPRAANQSPMTLFAFGRPEEGR